MAFPTLATARRLALKGALAALLALPVGMAAGAPAQAADFRIEFRVDGPGVRATPSRHGVRHGRPRYEQRVLPPRRIARRLNRQGFRAIRDIVYMPRRGVYRVEARDRRGLPVVIRADARTGEPRLVRYLDRRAPQRGRQPRAWQNNVSQPHIWQHDETERGVVYGQRLR